MRYELKRTGFTLIELLLVLTILGVLAAVVAPNVGTMLGGGRLAMGAREIASAAKYARTMALMNQTPVDLIIKQSTGEFEVKASPPKATSTLGMSDLAAMTNSVGYTESLIETSARRQASLSGGFGLAVSKAEREKADWLGETDPAADALAALLEEQGTENRGTVSLADSVDVSRKVDGVKFRFDGYRDTPSSHGAAKLVYDDVDASGLGTVVIRYRANGTVRPYRIVVSNANDEHDVMYVTVNAVGGARVAQSEADAK